MQRKGFHLLGHPVHPMLTAFPIGLWVTSLLWQILGVGLGSPLWWAMGFWCIAAGLVAAIVTATTGFADYIGLPSGDPAEGVAMRHLVVMLSAATAFLGSLLAQGSPAAPTGPRLLLTLGLTVLGVILLLFGGWLGGELVFRFGVGAGAAEASAAADQPVADGLGSIEAPNRLSSR